MHTPGFCYFIMVEKLLASRYVDREKYIRQIGPSAPRNFLNNIVSQIVIHDKKRAYHLLLSIQKKRGRFSATLPCIKSC